MSEFSDNHKNQTLLVQQINYLTNLKRLKRLNSLVVKYLACQTHRCAQSPSDWWQQTLMVTQEVPISCHSIGIRAHDFTTEPRATNQSASLTNIVSTF